MAVGNRWAAAVAMAGLAVMGPCAGQAWAQDTDTEAPASAAKRAGDGDRFGSAGRRAQPAVPDRAAPAVRRAAPTAEIARPVRSDRAGAAVRLRPSPVVPLAAAPARVVAVAAPAGVSDEESVGGAAPRATAGAVRVHRGAAVAVAAGSAQQIGAIGAAVNQFFDTLSAWLSGLPPNPFSGPVEGALLLVRRALFNQAPTAAPVQYVQNSTAILGTLGAVDSEGDPIVYELVEGPTYGAVEITEDGDWTYTPPDFGGTDSFTVKLTNPGPPLNLLGPNSTTVVVPVGVGAGIFVVYNRTSKPLYYRRLESGKLDNAPGVDTEIPVGGKLEFSVPRGEERFDGGYVWENNARVAFNTVKESLEGDWYAITFHRYEFNSASGPYSRTDVMTRSCYASGANKCFAPEERGKTYVDFFDPVNTVITVSGGADADRQKQATLLDSLCKDGGPAKCGPYSIQDLKDLGAVKEKTQVGSAAYNNSDAKATKTFSYSFTQSSTLSVDVTASVGVKIGNAVKAGLTARTGKSWTESATFTESVTQELLPFSYGVASAAPYLSKVRGDFTVTMGNTTWNLKDVEYTLPTVDKCVGTTCQGAYIFEERPLQEGFTIKDNNSTTPFDPVYTVGDRKQLAVTAYNGVGPTADYTKKATYTSSNPAVATVTDTTGVVTALSAGVTTISARYSWTINGQTVNLATTLPVTVVEPKA